MNRKLKMTTKNLAQLLLIQIEEAKWDLRDILMSTFELELEYMIRHSNRFEWFANKFVGKSTLEEILDINELIEITIRSDKKDALVLVRKVENLFWISIIMKNLKKIGIYNKPHYIALSSDERYFFYKGKKTMEIIQYLATALGYEKVKKLKLSGKSISSLLKLLARKENASANNRPIYQIGEAIENEKGIDFTQKKSFLDFYEKCVDNETDIDLQHFTVTSANCPWLGDDNPVLKTMKFESAVTFSGDVANIMKNLPIASIVKPPIPNYVRNYSVAGKNLITLKPPLNLNHFKTE